MKRLLLRMSALAIVLVLGFIAIAQAQRGGKEQPQDTTPAASSAPVAENTAAEPRLLPADMPANPLRNPRRNTRADSVQTAAETPAGKASGPEVLQAVPVSDHSPAPLADPFGPRSPGLPALNPAQGAASEPAPRPSTAAPPESTTRTTVPVPTSAPAAAPFTQSATAPAASRLPTTNFMPAIRGTDVTPLSGPRSAAATAESPAIATAPPTVGPPPAAASAPAPQIPASPQPLVASQPPMTAQPVTNTASANPQPSAAPRVVGTAGTTSLSEASRGRAVETSRPMRVTGSEEPGLFKPDSTAAGTSLPRTASSAARPASPSVTLGTDGPHRETSVGEGTGKPGSQQLEGPQTPHMTIQKTAPAEVEVGKVAKFLIKLKNTGPIAAQSVEVRDEIPKGARLVSAKPPASRGVRGELVWPLGTVKPGEETTLEVQIMPMTEGEIGSIASVSFHADASARTIATKPQLAVKMAGPTRVLIGEDVPLSITISNPGSGIAQKVVLEERLPAGLQHAAGPELEYEVGDLKPGETRQLELKLIATQAGKIVNTLAARGEGNLRAEDRLELEVLSPQLDLVMEGPKRRYLEREAVYTFSVSNPGTASAKQVELVAQLPPGLKFVNANNSGQYQEASRTVHWSLEELPSRETGSVSVTTIPVEMGEQTLRLRGTAERGLSVEKEHPVLIEGIAAVLFELADTKDPIEVGGETTYEIRVVNQGSKAAGNVQVTLSLPPEMKALATEPPQATISGTAGTTIAFERLQNLAPKANITYRVRVQGLRPGDLRIRAQLQTDEFRVPVTKEESTRVYSDE